MPIPIQCTCGLVMEAPEASVGQTCECPQCKQQFVIPAPAGAAATQSPSAAQQQQAAAQQAAAQQAAARQAAARKKQAIAAQRQQAQPAPDPGGMGSLLDEVGVQKARSRHSCPGCRADVERDAIICIQCGMNLETGDQVEKKLYASAGGMRKADIRAAELAERKAAAKQSYSHADDELSLPLKILSFLIPIAGLVIYYKNRHDSPAKANTAKNLASAAILIGLLLMLVSYLVNR